MRYTYILVALLLAACSSTGVIPMDSGTYMIAKRSVQAGFGPPDGVKADVYREANEFCAKENKEVKTLNLDVTNSGLAQPGNVSLKFMCLDANNSELVRPKLNKEQRDSLAFLDERLKTLVNQLIAGFTGSSDIRVAVLPIENASGAVSGPFGNYLTERLTNNLYAKVKVVERAQLKKVIDELALTQGGNFDEGSAKKIGRFLGVDAVVTGTYAELGNQTIEVNSRMVRVETGEVLGAGTIQIPSSAVQQLLR